jgi:hypothetical protein
MSSWLERRRISKNESTYCELVTQGQLAAAIEFYERSLAANAAEVGKPLRALYHLSRWIAEPNADNFIRLWDLASAADKTSQVARAGALVQRLSRQLRLAEILHRRDGARLDEQPGTPADEPDAQSVAIERLAAAILECGRMGAGTRPVESADAAEVDLARRVLGILPAHDALPAPSVAHARLLVWARLTVGQPERLYQDEPAIAVLAEEEKQAVRLAAVLLSGKLAVAGGDMKNALAALGLVGELGGSKRRDAAVIDWGVNAFEHNSAAAIKWFSSQSGADAGAARTLIGFALSLASFRNGRLAEGRELLARLDGSATPLPASVAGEDLHWQSCVLNALSHVAATREWPGPGSDAADGGGDSRTDGVHGYLAKLGLSADAPSNVRDEHERQYREQLRADYKARDDALLERRSKGKISKSQYQEQKETLLADLRHEERQVTELKNDYAERKTREPARGGIAAAPRESSKDQEIKAKNRTLWTAARLNIASSLDRLANAPAQWSWWAPLLTGLIAYTDHNVTLSLDEIARFAAAIEHVESATARTRLREIEASLISRANAVEQASLLIREKRYNELSQFNASVFSHFADSISAPVRAAVHMTLWNADPAYDPLPELLRIPVQPADEALIGGCISEVRLAHAMGQLAQCLGAQSPAAPPAWEQFESAGSEGASLAGLAAALFQIRDGKLDAATADLSRIAEESHDPLVVYTRFYVAWRQGDGGRCLAQLSKTNNDNPFLRRQHPAAVIAARALSVLEALKHDRLDEAVAVLKAAANNDLGDPALLTMLVSIVPWLMQHQMTLAARKLLHGIREELPPDAAAAADHRLYPLRWACLAFEPLLTAQLGQYSACMATADRVIAAALPQRVAFGESEADAQMLAWCKLFRIEAELGLSTTMPTDEMKLRWRSLQRALEDRAGELSRLEPVRPYALLISGLLSALSTDMIVDQTTLRGLAAAQRELDLGQHASFLERAIGKSQSRHGVLAAFWDALRQGNLTRGRQIYRQELLPIFGERIPSMVQLAMLVADWGADAATTEELMQRLDLLHYEAADLPADVVAKFRSYIADGEKIREITRLLREQRFDALIELIEKARWTDMQPGAMPVAVALTELYAFFKTKNTEETARFATDIANARNIAEWVRDDGALLLGYVSFGKREFPQASAAFEKISGDTLLGHNIDHYWAAAQFNEGLQLLEVDNKDKAFRAFDRSLRQRSGTAKISNLTPLFIHFGLKGLEAGAGSRARQAFELATYSVREAEPSAQVAFNELVAELGELLCRALTDEDVRSVPPGDEFLELLSVAELLPEQETVVAAMLYRTLHILAICQELRRQWRLPAAKRMKPPQLAKFLHEQIAALEKLVPQLKQHDPMVGVLKGVVDLLLIGGSKTTTVLDELDGALRLGVQSQKLAELLSDQRELIKNALAKKTGGMNLLDAYLASGEVPSSLAEDLNNDDTLSELYRLDRGYVPADIRAEPKQSDLETLLARFKALQIYAESEAVKSNPKFSKLGERLKEQIGEITTAKDQLLEVEKDMMQELAAFLRAQTIDGGKPA